MGIRCECTGNFFLIGLGKKAKQLSVILLTFGVQKKNKVHDNSCFKKHLVNRVAQIVRC